MRGVAKKYNADGEEVVSPARNRRAEA